MFDSIFQMSEIKLFALLSGASIIISVIAVFLIKWMVPLDIRYKDNPVLGNISALISIIYGVLAGLTALYLINTYSDTNIAVQREADAVANLYRDTQWLKEPTRTKMQTEIKTYVKRIIDTEWSLMKQGAEINNEGDKNIDMLSLTLKQYNIAGNADILIVHDLLDEIKTLYNARQERIASSHTELNPEFWIVILIGTVLTIMINYLFGMNFYLHLLTASAATLMAFSMIFLLVTLDRPFQGEFVIEPDAFKPILAYIENSKT